MCDPCCLIFGCNTASREIPKPENYGDVPDKVLCPHCSEITKPIYKREYYYFSICFIPLCPCGTSDPYMACSCCGGRLNYIKDDACSNCHVTTPFDAEYCPNCGTSKREVQARRLHVH